MMRWVFGMVFLVIAVSVAIWLQYRFPDMKEAITTALGAFIALAGTWFFSSRDTEKAARYLAIRIVCVLDKFVEDCVAVVSDDGLCHGQRTEDGRRELQVKSPGPPVYPDDVDWKSIDHGLMYEMLSFPSDVEAGDNVISFSWDVSHPPDYDEGFEERAFRYAGFGLKAYELAKKLREKHDIPDKSYEDWNPVAELRKELEKIEARRKKYEADHAEWLSKMQGAA